MYRRVALLHPTYVYLQSDFSFRFLLCQIANQFSVAYIGKYIFHESANELIKHKNCLKYIPFRVNVQIFWFVWALTKKKCFIKRTQKELSMPAFSVLKIWLNLMLQPENKLLNEFTRVLFSLRKAFCWRVFRFVNLLQKILSWGLELKRKFIKMLVNYPI